MVSGCGIVDLLEAAHIAPYRGPEYNHLENGLLLRADIHTLFDLNLLRIEPGSLKVMFHPVALDGDYNHLEGVTLRTGLKKPSPSCLQLRYLAAILGPAEPTRPPRHGELAVTAKDLPEGCRLRVAS